MSYLLVKFVPLELCARFFNLLAITNNSWQTGKQVVWNVISLNQYVSHDFDALVSIIWLGYCLNATRVGVIMLSPWTKPDSGVTALATNFVVTNDTDSRLWKTLCVAFCIEPFSVAVVLQGALRTKQALPRVTANWYGAELPISDQWVQGVSALVKGDKIRCFLSRDLHTETDLGKWGAPVCWQLGLLCVKPSFGSCCVECYLVAPKTGIIVEGLLKNKKRSTLRDYLGKSKVN